MKILVINGGSSSLKCWFSDLPDSPLPMAAQQPHWSAHADWSHHSGIAEVQIKRSDGATAQRQLQVDAPVAVLEPVLELLWKGDAKVIGGPSDIDVVGHRIVHGGPKFRESTALTADVRSAIAQQVEFAPAHNRFELEAIEAIDHVLAHHMPLRDADFLADFSLQFGESKGKTIKGIYRLDGENLLDRKSVV